VTIRKPLDPALRPEMGRSLSFDPGADTLLGSTWLAHVEALRQARLAAEDAEAERVRGIVIANTELLRARRLRGDR
jgi:hypothetical protein